MQKEHPKPLDDTFVGIEVKGVSYSEKAEGGQKIIDACKEMTSPDPVPLGKYRGFDLELSFDTFEKAYQVKNQGQPFPFRLFRHGRHRQYYPNRQCH